MGDKQSHTFFVVAETGLDGKPRRIVSPDSEDVHPRSIDGFDADMFPLCVVSAVFLAVRLRPYSEELCQPWRATALPSGMQTLVAQWPREFEFFDRSITIDGQPVKFGNEITLVDRIEASTCSYGALLVSERAIHPDVHIFLTTGQRTLYR